MGDYLIVTTAETNENRVVKRPGAINGGFYQKSNPDQHTRITISVDDIYEAMKKIEEVGGKVIGEQGVKELFAESYAFYILRPLHLLKLNRGRYAFLKQKVFQRREYL